MGLDRPSGKYKISHESRRRTAGSRKTHTLIFNLVACVPLPKCCRTKIEQLLHGCSGPVALTAAEDILFVVSSLLKIMSGDTRLGDCMLTLSCDHGSLLAGPLIDSYIQSSLLEVLCGIENRRIIVGGNNSSAIMLLIHPPLFCEQPSVQATKDEIAAVLQIPSTYILFFLLCRMFILNTILHSFFQPSL